MLPEDRIRVLHMIEAGEAALSFVKDRAYADLESDTMLRFALVRAIEVIGEAANKISAPTRADSKGIPWRRIVSMRHRLVHAYFDINHEILWKTATAELPSFPPQLRELIDKT